MNSGPPMNFVMQQPVTPLRKRNYNPGKSSLNDLLQNESLDDSFLTSMGIKDNGIFAVPSSDTSFSSFMNKSKNVETKENAPPCNMKEKPSLVGHQPTSSTPKKMAKNNEIIEQKVDEKAAEIQVAAPLADKKANSSKKLLDENDSGEAVKVTSFMRKPRQLGSYSVTSLEKESQNLMEHLKEERDKTQMHFAEYAKALRGKTEAIINSLENIVKTRYEELDKSLQFALNDFGKEWETGKTLEEEVCQLKAEIASIVSHLQVPFSDGAEADAAE